VIAVDLNERVVDLMGPRVTRSAVGDGRQQDVLERLGAGECDAGVISTGDDITASVLSTLALRDLGVSQIYVKVISNEHARVMTYMGVAETIFPEREAAVNLSARLASSAVFSYVKLGAGFGMQEMTMPASWEWKTLRDLDLREHHKVSVIAVHDVVSDQFRVPPDPDEQLKDTDTLLMIGREANLEKLSKKVQHEEL
jgi:trk system potassium uptake protein TrkA